MIVKVEDKICKPLDQLLDPVRGEMGLAKEALAELHKSVEGTAAADLAKAEHAVKRTDQLIEALNRVLDAMGEVTTINKIIKAIIEIASAEQREYERLKALKEKMELKIIEDALGPAETPKK
jgi:hypothetical protein